MGEPWALQPAGWSRWCLSRRSWRLRAWPSGLCPTVAHNSESESHRPSHTRSLWELWKTAIRKCCINSKPTFTRQKNQRKRSYIMHPSSLIHIQASSNILHAAFFHFQNQNHRTRAYFSLSVIAVVRVCIWGADLMSGEWDPTHPTDPEGPLRQWWRY